MGINYGGGYSVPRADLAMALHQHVLRPTDFIGTQVLTLTPVNRKTGIFTAHTRETIAGAYETRRSVKGAYARGTLGSEDVTYECSEYGFEHALGDDERAHFASDFDAEADTAAWAQGVLLREQEKRIAAALFNTTTFTGADLFTDNSGTPWDSASTNIVDQVDTARDVLYQNCGIEPNTLIIPRFHRTSLKTNTDLLGRIQYVARADEQTMLNALADIFGVQRVLIAGGSENTADEGQTWSGDDIWSRLYAFLCVSAPIGSSMSAPSIGRTFLWTQDSPDNTTVEEYREEQTRSNVFRVRQHVQELVIDANFGHLIQIDAA